MALSQGTNGTSYSYTPPKPPKPQVSYGAPSGPYAGPISTSNGVPTYRDPNDLYQARGGGFATPENNLANRYMSGVMGGVLGMFNPYSYTSMPASLNYARKHPGEALHQMFGTAEGWGGLTAGALTAAVPAPKGLSALKNMRAARELEAAPAIPKGVQWAPGARAAIDAHFGPEMSAATRASMLSQAPSMAEILAERTALADRVAPKTGGADMGALREAVAQHRAARGQLPSPDMAAFYTGVESFGRRMPNGEIDWGPDRVFQADRLSNTGGHTAGKLTDTRSIHSSIPGSASTIGNDPWLAFDDGLGLRLTGRNTLPAVTKDPMKGKFFTHTGSQEYIDPEAHLAQMQRRMQSGNQSPDFYDAYDEYLNDPNAFRERPGNIHNVQDKSGNTVGSLTWDEHPAVPGDFRGVDPEQYMYDPLSREKHIAAQTGYIRPDKRGDYKTFKDLVQPLLDKNLPITANFANTDWENMFKRLVNKGRVKAYQHPSEFGREVLPGGPFIPGFKDPETGLYPYEIPRSQLPPLIGSRPVPTLYPFAMEGLGRQLKYGRRTGGF